MIEASPSQPATTPESRRNRRRGGQRAGADRRRSFIGADRSDVEGAAGVIPIPSNVRVWIATGHNDMRAACRGWRSRCRSVEARPTRRRPLHFQRPQRRSGEGALARRRRPVAVCEAARPGQVRLAVGERGRGVDFGGADGLHVGRDRLAQSATHLEAGERGLRAPAGGP